jgi:hypothetical protein
MMRCLPGRTFLQNCSVSLLHSRAIFIGSVSRFLAAAFWPPSAIAMHNKTPSQLIVLDAEIDKVLPLGRSRTTK